MSDPNKAIPELGIPERLGHLIKYCEKSCVAECCGVDAFDLSPLHVASFISASTGAIDARELSTWLALIDELDANFRAIPPSDPAELACMVTPMNQLFTEEAVRALIAELRSSVTAAPQVLELSNQLEAPIHAWKVMKDYSDKQRPKLP
jgi:hypothetical protein